MTAEQAVAFRREKKENEKEILKISAHSKGLEESFAWLDFIGALESEVLGLQRQQLALSEERKPKKTWMPFTLPEKPGTLKGSIPGSLQRDQQEKEICKRMHMRINLQGIFYCIHKCI